MIEFLAQMPTDTMLLSRNGSSGLRGIVDSAEMGGLGCVIGEGAKISFFAEARLLGFGL
jgi:hypothetical protein